MVIVTGGIISMTTDDEPNSINLVSGAAVGGTLGAVLSYISSGSFSSLYSLSPAPPDMKVGLPAF